MSMLTIEERKRVFEAEIAKYVRQGWRVVKRNEPGDPLFALLYRGNEACNLMMGNDGTIYPIILRR